MGGLGEAVTLDGTKGAAHTLGHVGAAVVSDDEAAARNEIDEAFERCFDGFEVGVDVSVVKLNVREDERGGKVVEELGALVKERGVVFVAFEDEVARGAELEAGAEVLRDAADEERRLKRGIGARGDLVDPREHAGGGGFAVGSGDDEGLAAFEEFFAQQRGHGGERNTLVEDALDLGIAARKRIADDDEIGKGIDVEVLKQLLKIEGFAAAKNAREISIVLGGRRRIAVALTGEITIEARPVAIFQRRWRVPPESPDEGKGFGTGERRARAR